jgi:hypothetical protein
MERDFVPSRQSFKELKKTPKRFHQKPEVFSFKRRNVFLKARGLLRSASKRIVLSGKNTAMPKSSFDKEDSNMAIHC